MPSKCAIIAGLVLGVLLGGSQTQPLKAVPLEISKSPTPIEIIRSRVAWPCGVTLLKDHKVVIRDQGILYGSVTINAGVNVKAIGLRDDGVLTVRFAGQVIAIPIEETNFLDLVRTPEVVKKALRQDGTVAKPDPKRTI